MVYEASRTAIVLSDSFGTGGQARDYGRLPISFYFHKRRRLIMDQISALGSMRSRKVVVIPSGFDVDSYDGSDLRRAGVELLFSETSDEAGVPLLRALDALSLDGEVLIVEGDLVLKSGMHGPSDWISISNYANWHDLGRLREKWLISQGIAGGESVFLTGLISVSSAADLRSALKSNSCNLVNALQEYACKKELVLRDLGRDVVRWSSAFFEHGRYRVGENVRKCNKLTLLGDTLIKSSKDGMKIGFEAQWLRNVPPAVRRYCAAVFDQGVDAEGNMSYKMAFIGSPLLHDMYIYGVGPSLTWRSILDSCFEFLRTCASIRPLARDIDYLSHLTVWKMESRLEQCRRLGLKEVDEEWKLNGEKTPSLARIAEQVGRYIADSAIRVPGIMHGDFCFTNIFYDWERSSIVVIDPRGSSVEGKASLFGDIVYDLGKLKHSVEGYDTVIDGRYYLCEADERRLEFAIPPSHCTEMVRSLVRQYDVKGVLVSDPIVVAVAVSLFLTMLPLHQDRPDRQRAFIACALRLFLGLNS